MKFLFLPILQIPMGHHTVADAMIRSLEQRVWDIECKKVDFFSYVDKSLEKAIRLTYLSWINHSPHTYGWIYLKSMHTAKTTKQFNFLEYKFLQKMNNFLKEENPDFIVCTSSIPSFIIDRLRHSGVDTPPVINVYTDFWVNKLWGGSEVDYHFVPDQNFKDELIAQNAIDASKILITGIPVDECFTPKTVSEVAPPYHILISGGSSGLGDIKKLINTLRIDNEKSYQYSLLCGKNQKLYDSILALETPNIRPLSYISSREAMNALYNEADAIITKPGGVTISEALHKRLPIFVFSSLPGQEEINKEYLLKRELIYDLDLKYPIGGQLNRFFQDKKEQTLWFNRADRYLSETELPAWQKLMEIAYSDHKLLKYENI
ncbi:MAG: galactosyldiacylglycerol synthase [Eubacteriaceae bacterium]|nr:galactosyldiacylglycerol synthase [Eubacteriaceae bacterium]